MLQLIFWIAAFAPSCVGHSWNQLGGRHYRVGATMAAPYLFEVRRGNGSELDGVLKQVFDFVFHPVLNASYDFVFIDTKKVKEKGYVLVFMDQLLDGEVDVSTLGYIPTEERSRIMDFSGPALITQHVLAVPYPKEKSKLMGIIRPFQLPVWILFLLTMGCLVTTLSIMSKWRKKHSTRNEIRPKSFVEHFGDNTIYVLTVLIGNGEYYRGRQLWLRLVLSSWCLTCVVLINAYTGNLTSYLTLPTTESIPNSFEDLVARKDLHLAVAKKSILGDIILTSSTEPLKTLGDRLRQKPEYLYNDHEDVMNLITTRKIVVVLVSVVAIQKVHEGLKQYHECRLTYSKPLSLYLLYVYGFPKNWPYKDAFNSRLQYIWDFGLLNRWIRMYVKQPDQCLSKKKESPRKAAMKLEDFSGAFVLFAAGFILSLLVFFLEVVAGKVKNDNQEAQKTG